MNKKVTIQDIADELGISRNTVSKAINNSEGLADATRERVLQKAVEMGYKQFSYVGALAAVSGAAAATATDNPQTQGYQGEIALVTGAFLTHSHFASLMLDKFQREISQLGYTMNTHRVTPVELENKTLPITMNLDQIKAIMCIEMFDWDYDEMLCGLGIPILFVDGPAKRGGRNLPADQLYMDNFTEISRFVNDMLGKGFTKIGFVGDYDHCQSFFERYTAFYLTMLMAGQKVEDHFVIRQNHREELTEIIPDMPELPEVFICANDFVATDLMQALAAAGKRVPEDVRICGFDDSAESRLSKPPLTTVHIHTQVIAYSAVHLLISRIKAPSLDYRTIHTETDLIYRESTGTL
ncbi:MAG: LacI family DNA-binding transcriptional regulator [Clostridiales bacterium]|nr:LacI family DNA-binding transcriptional regulator [Clostridiales bacterium]